MFTRIAQKRIGQYHAYSLTPVMDKPQRPFPEELSITYHALRAKERDRYTSPPRGGIVRKVG